MWVGVAAADPAPLSRQVGEVLSELGPALSEPLARGHPGVLTALTAACRRHPPLQQEALCCLFQVGHAPCPAPATPLSP